MNIAILGYGKMGHIIEQVAQQRGYSVVLRASAQAPFLPKDLEGADVAIEFSTPDTAVDNIFKCFEARCPVVVGTTGWYMRLPEVRTEAEKGGHSLLYATNFSIGVNVFFHLNSELARIMNSLEEYEPGIEEIHHTAKLDKPSGTAITLAEGIVENVQRKTSWVNAEPMQASELQVHSIREGDVPGTHHVRYKSAHDTITMTHEAHGREGFALGAVRAAEWLQGRKGIFTMSDFLKF